MPTLTPALSLSQQRPSHGHRHIATVDLKWEKVRDRFLEAVDASQRSQVKTLLQQPRYGGHGLRAWLRSLVWNNGRIPPAIPVELIEVYLDEPEALPLHDCADCGLAIPVRPMPNADYDVSPAWEYFEACPCCGGPTGLFAYYSNAGDSHVS